MEHKDKFKVCGSDSKLYRDNYDKVFGKDKKNDSTIIQRDSVEQDKAIRPTTGVKVGPENKQVGTMAKD
jgi:hypothetical protein